MDLKEIRIGVMIDYHCHSLLYSSERLRCSTSTGHAGKGSGRYLLVSYGGISLRARCEGAVLILTIIIHSEKFVVFVVVAQGNIDRG